MASNLCCIAEEDERACSPELLNARLSRAVPIKQHLVPEETNSPNSHFTSDHSRELYELRDIFHNARHPEDNRPMPARPILARFSRPSLHNIRSLHRITSMSSIIKRKLSKEFYRKKSSSSTGDTQARDGSPKYPPDTVIKQQKKATKRQLQITKEDLRNNLLSHKKPNEGGYDPDATVLDNVARNIGGKSPNKRPSIHSVDWVTTPDSKSTPDSLTQGRTNSDPERDLHPYEICQTPAVPGSNKFSQVYSTPNLQSETSVDRGRKLRRSHSTESRVLLKPFAFSPLQIPGLGESETTSKAWSKAVDESLQMARSPMLPHHISAQTSQTDLTGDNYTKYDQAHQNQERSNVSTFRDFDSDMKTRSVACSVEIRVQQPTLSTTPRPSTSMRDTIDEISPSATVVHLERSQSGEEDDDSRRSVHLHSMRISHHLRSGSLLSWDKLANASELPNPQHTFSEHNPTDLSRVSNQNRQRSRFDRQTSSSGITSSKIPARWGKVLPSDGIIPSDSASSVYSYRPQSLLGSFCGSMGTLPLASTEDHCFSISSTTRKSRRSTSSATDNAETLMPTQRHDLMPHVASNSHLAASLPHALPTAPLARKNSVANTKVSKFREEFSPPAPRRKLGKSSSIIKLLTPKRLRMRSHSEANLRSEAPIISLDGPSDTLGAPTDRERRQSQFLISLRAEQQALGRNEGANSVWDRALHAHQEEKASLFLSKNRELAVHASHFRERSASVSTKPTSINDPDLSIGPEGSSRGLSTPKSRAPDDERGEQPPPVVFRRSALRASDQSEPGRELASVYERQGDGKDVVGAWGSYPSHTRNGRAGSAGKAESVLPRDFALEAAVSFPSTKDEEDSIGPTQCRPSTPLLPGEKKNKKRLGGGRLRRSSSMTLSKSLVKNYTKMFKSQSTEFRRHGRGHRTSIASGGILEHPELELLPEVWAEDFTKNENSTGSLVDHRSRITQDHCPKYADKGKGRVRLGEDDHMATLRARRLSSAPNLSKFSFCEDATKSQHVSGGARIWSGYYQNCVDTYPRLSSDGNNNTGDPNASTGFLFNDKQTSRRSSIMLDPLGDEMQRAGEMSHPSQQNSCNSPGGDDGTAEVKSLVSVRRSTMDLISKFKEQEATEHEKILTLTQGGNIDAV